jgi:hypothetical protein
MKSSPAMVLIGREALANMLVFAPPKVAFITHAKIPMLFGMADKDRPVAQLKQHEECCPAPVAATTCRQITLIQRMFRRQK